MNETVRIKLESLRSQYDALTAQMGEPDVAANYEKMAQLVLERTLIAPVVDLMSEYENHAHTLADAQRILSEEDQELRELAEVEIEEAKKEIEKLENASKHPDLGPLGDGLITLMDQKLSQLDQRLYELTSKIQVAQSQKDVQIKKGKKIDEIENKVEGESKPVFEKPIVEFVNKSSKKFEITTLTSLPKLDPVKQSKYDQMLSQLSSDVITPPPMKPKIQESTGIDTPELIEKNVIPVIEEKTNEDVEQIVKPVLNKMPQSVVELPEESEIDDEDDDIEQIKSKILKTLSKIEQAEVD